MWEIGVGLSAFSIFQHHHQYTLERISEVTPASRAFYIFGMGKHPKSTYVSLKNTPGLEVIWYGSLIPSYLSPFRILVASYEGIVKISDAAYVKDVFETLSKMSMVGLYIFDKGLENSFIQTIKSRKYSRYADEVVKDDPSYFIYQVDADNTESSTGIYEIVSYGKHCPKELTSALNLGL